MTIDLFPLLQFMTEHGRSEALLPDAWCLVREVASFANGRGEHPYGPRRVDPTILSDAVRQVTGRKVEHLAFIPLACPMPNDAYMFPEAFRSPFAGRVAPPPDMIEKPVAVELYRTVQDAFLEPMEDAIGERLANSPWAGFAGSIANDVVDALYAYLVCVIADDAVRALTHQLYLECATSATLVGELDDRPGTWVAIAA